MHLMTRIFRALGWPAPAVHVPTRPARLRAECDVCGKRLAVIASTGRLWRHRCRPEPPIPADRVDEDDERGGRR